MIRPWALTVCFVCDDFVLSFRFFRPEINERDKIVERQRKGEREYDRKRDEGDPSSFPVFVLAH